MKKKEQNEEQKKTPLKTDLDKAKKMDVPNKTSLYNLKLVEEDSIYVKHDDLEDSIVNIDNSAIKKEIQAENKDIDPKNNDSMEDNEKKDNDEDDEENNEDESKVEDESKLEDESKVEDEEDESKLDNEDESKLENDEEGEDEEEEEGEEEEDEEEDNDETKKEEEDEEEEEENEDESKFDNEEDDIEGSISYEKDSDMNDKTRKIIDALDTIRLSENMNNSLVPYSMNSSSRENIIIQDSVDESNAEIDEANVKIIKYLGSGGEGRVYLANITTINEYVALKQFEIKTDQSNYKKTVKTLFKEVDLVKSLNHANIIKYYSLRKSNYKKLQNTLEYNLIMEYMDNGSISDLIKVDSKGLPKPRIAEIIKQILSGLQYLHAHNVIHRDLKPANILTNKALDTFKITDFGISTQVKENMTTVKRTCAGTPWYMAPEVILDEPYSYGADIWSLCCLCFELFCGARPDGAVGGIEAMFQVGE